MTDIFSDVDEAVRRERYLYLWRRYGLYAVGGAVALALLVGVAFVWDAQERAERRAASFAFDEALLLEGSAKIGALARLSQRGGIYAHLADFHRASLFVEEGRQEEALEIYSYLGEGNFLPENLRALSRLHAARLSMERNSFEETEAYLSASLEKSAPFRFSARDLLASAALFHGEPARARALYEGLALDIDTPASIKARAQIMLKYLPSAEASHSEKN